MRSEFTISDLIWDRQKVNFNFSSKLWSTNLGLFNIKSTGNSNLKSVKIKVWPKSAKLLLSLSHLRFKIPKNSQVYGHVTISWNILFKQKLLNFDLHSLCSFYKSKVVWSDFSPKRYDLKLRVISCEISGT